MRGDYSQEARRWLLVGRAIPTCVGTTSLSREISDHGPGPSPHAWGLRVVLRASEGGTRAIPTCVGTTSPPGGGFSCSSGHPHMRGDYT